MTTFNDMYQGRPPWDIGRVQPVFAKLFEEGRIRGRVLDAGCGTGDIALYLAEQGLDVWGIDAAPRAIELAKRKAETRGLEVTFREYNALDLAPLGKSFDAVIDSGLFHTFNDDERPLYAEGVQAVLNTDGTLFILCFSDKEPPGWGPRRVTQAEIRAVFQRGWQIEEIREAHFETNFPDRPRVAAWLAVIRKTAGTIPGVW